MATTKVENYTAQQAEDLKQAWLAKPTRETVEQYAEKFAKSTRSIISKLSSMKVYQKTEYTTKNGEKPVKKDVTAEAIGKVLRLSEPEVDSLTKANKGALRKIFDALANSVPVEVLTDEQAADKTVKAQAIALHFDLDADSLTALNSATIGVLSAIVEAMGEEK